MPIEALSQHTGPNNCLFSDFVVYGYSTVAVVIISLFPLFALFVVKLRHKSYYKYLLVLMLGLGVGSLAGDALLHLIPEVGRLFHNYIYVNTNRNWL